MTEPRHVLVAVAWPYANGLQHLGHIAGCYLPSDIFARYHRIAGHRVLMVSGSDAHGTPITLKAEQEGVEPRGIVDRYHPRIFEQWERLGISFDLFTSTMTDNHRRVVQGLFTTLWEQGYLDTRTQPQFYDAEAGRFLPDRYVEGTCPHCDYGEARGDQCDSCGRVLDPEDLGSPRSRFTGTAPEMRDTEHFFLLLPKLEDRLLRWLEGREGWRSHVVNWALGFIRETGLHERAITRDLEWGVPLPDAAEAELEGGEGKRIYVWFEAVIGYLSASRQWAAEQGRPDAWKAWWTGPDAESYYFIGKDNIDFHAIFWPAMLLGYNDGRDEPLSLPTDVPANQYVTFRGEKASKSRGVGAPVLEWLDEVGVDELRYAVAANLPEYHDTNLTRAQMQRRINDELVATWGNLANRVLSMIRRWFDSVVPAPGELDGIDRELLERVDRLLAEEAELIEEVELRAALRKPLEAAKAANGYLNRREPWQTADSDEARTATTLYVALQAVSGINLGMAPYVPFSAARLYTALGGEAAIAGWERPDVPAGTVLGDTGPLYEKVELVET